MWILWVLLAVILIIWGLGLWFRRTEDLSVFDGPIDSVAAESFALPDGPSAEHQQAVAEIQLMGGKVEGLSRKEMLQFTRAFMEDMPRGKSFDCEFVPVDANGVPAEWVMAPGVDPSRRVLYIHGGAFIAGSPGSHRTVTTQFSAVANAAVLAIDYRLMPENRREEGINDCKSAYRWILENGPDGKSPPSRLYMGGDSAGGNLSLVMSNWVRDQKLRAPDAVIAMSPVTDCTYSAPSIKENLATDVMLGPLFGILLKIPKPILTWIFILENRMVPNNPVVSPVLDDLSGLPPTLVQVSESEMLLGDAQRYAGKAHAAGSPVRLQSWPGLLHVWQIFHPEVPEARDAWIQIDRFLKEVEASGA